MSGGPLHSGKILSRGRKSVSIAWDTGGKSSREYGEVFYPREVIRAIDEGMSASIQVNTALKSNLVNVA
jgi:hypothetical protein